MTREKRQINMLTDPPGRALILFAIPMILGNLFQQFYNIMDSIVVGRFVGETALASVGASYSITNVFIAIAIGGGIGSSVIVSQCFGAKQISRMKTAVSTTLINFLIISILLGIMGFCNNHRILMWMNTPENVIQDAAVYLEIYFIGLPFLFMYNVQASIFNALGDSKTPLYLLIFSSILNIILDLILVIVFHKGVAGVAIATLIAQGLSAFISFFFLIKKLKTYESKEDFRFFDLSLLWSMSKVALPSILQQSIVHIGMLLVQSVVNGFGSAILAGYAAGTRIESICIVPMLAIGNAMSTFTAQNMGAHNPERVRQGYRTCYIMIGCVALLLCITMQLFGGVFISAFLDPESGKTAYETGLNYVRFIAFFYVFIGLKTTTDGLLRGAGDVVLFTIANLVNLSIRVWVAFQFAPVWGVQAVWFAIPMGWAANYIISFCWYLTGRWTKIKLISRI